MIIFRYDNAEYKTRNIYTDIALRGHNQVNIFRFILGCEDRWDIRKAFNQSATRMFKDSKKFKHETFTQELP